MFIREHHLLRSFVAGGILKAQQGTATAASSVPTEPSAPHSPG